MPLKSLDLRNMMLLPIVMDSLSYLGFLYQTQGRWEEALTLYDQSLVSAAQLRNQDSSS